MNIYCIIFLNYFFIILSEASKNRSIVDLTYSYNDKYNPALPKYSSFDLRLLNKGSSGPSGQWLYSNEIMTGEHVGTHIDAPIHINETLLAVDEIPIEELYRIPGIMINVSSAVTNSSNANYAIQVKDIENWMKKYGHIPDAAIVIFRTGWSSKINDQKAYFGGDAQGIPNFPGLSSEAAEWIVKYRNNSTNNHHGIIAVAIDTLSLDPGNTNKFTSHLILLKAGIYGIENIAHTEKLPAGNFTITMLPMKVAKGSGSPTRIIAEINGIPYSDDVSSSQRLISYSNLFLWCLCSCLLLEATDFIYIA